MFARAASGTVIGVEAHAIIVECHRANGLPGLALIGLARGAVRESSVRVRSAIVALGLQLGTHKLVVNLLPAELPKDASALDMALAVSLIASGGAVPLESLVGRRFYGELSLGGAVEAGRGAVLLADLARRQGDIELIVPRANQAEAAMIPGVRVVGVDHLREVVEHLSGRHVLTAAAPPGPAANHNHGTACLGEVFGQTRAKRALELAAAGGHNLLLIGPPGSGKTMLARRLPSLLPPLDADQSIEVTRIHSAAGTAPPNGLLQTAPFRAPHHTASEPALCGGGSVPRPGEITLAHRGVLFLDELPEFSRRALESLREPLEEGHIHIARTAMSLCFPAQVLLIAAMNPCPCGHFSEDEAATVRRCVCAFEQIQRYRSRISGPLLDRIDMHVMVQAVPYRDFRRRGCGEGSAQVRLRVLQARQMQIARLGTGRTNAGMSGAELQKYVQLPAKALRVIETAMNAHGLSSRAVGRILKVARTVADLAQSEEVLCSHIREAVNFRILDRNSAG